MNKLNFITSKLIIILIATTCLIPQTSIAQEQKNNNVRVESNSLLQRIISLFKAPENSLTTRSRICFIAPGNIGEQTVWSDRPLLVMRGTIPQGKINLYSSSANFNYERDAQLLWTQEIPANTTTIPYQGEELQPGFTYDWEFIAEGEANPPLSFILIPEADRKAIADRLTAITTDLQTKKATPEDIAIAQSDYFVSQQLWSDALQQLYLVTNPSANLTNKINEIEQHLCQAN